MKTLVLCLLGRRLCVKVSGSSMQPTFHDGDTLIVDPLAFRSRQPDPGDLIVARHPFKKSSHLVKRVVRCDSDGSFFVQGDNPAASTDSRSLGNIPQHLLIGRVIACL